MLVGDAPITTPHGLLAYVESVAVVGDDTLVIGVASSALFDLAESHAVFETDGEDAYRAFQEANYEVQLKPGLAFPFVMRLLEFVPGSRTLEPAVRACDEDGGVLFTLCAPGVDDLVSVAKAHEVMHAKTTYVKPKPRTGVFLR